MKPKDAPESANIKPLRADARRNRERVLQAAEAVFAEYGLGASTEEVARQAGVGVATVFRHFVTKEALILAILERRQGQLLTELQPQIDHPDPALGLAGFFTVMVEQARAKKVFVQALEQVGINFRTSGPSVSADLRRALDHLLERAQQVGTVRLDVNGTGAWALLTGLCQAALGQHWTDDVQRTVLDVVVSGLAPDRSVPGAEVKRP